MSNTKPKKKKSFFWLLFKIALLCFFLGVFGILAFYFSVRFGAFGKLPTTAELSAIKNPVASEIYANDGTLLGKYYIENRSNVPYKNISSNILLALVATEDSRFFEHGGVDSKSVLRVIFKTLLMGNSSSGGGSTLSQQLIKNLYGRERHGKLTMPVNKIKEGIIATRLEKVYDKNEVLALYLNTVSFGERAFGIGTAAERFFSTNAKDITLAEAATLIGMLKAPTAYSPRRNPEKSKRRRNVVLAQMFKKGYLTRAQADEAQAQPLGLKYNRQPQSKGLAPYFRATLKQELKEWAKQNPRRDGELHNIFTDGLKIYTTIDPNWQRYAEEGMRKHMSKLQQVFNEEWTGERPWGDDNDLVVSAMRRSDRYKRMKDRGLSNSEINLVFNKPIKMKVFGWEGEDGVVEKTMSPLDSIIYYQYFLHAGFLAMDPKTGEIKAWVGGIDHSTFKNDHIKQKRQVGSTFKPIVYATALENGIDPCEYFPNELRQYNDHQNWAPRNADGEYGGYFSMKGALAKSVNTVSVQVLFRATVKKVIKQAKKLGIINDLPEVPSIALGTAELTLPEMLSAYCSFANGGYEMSPIYLKRIEDKKGRRLAGFTNKRHLERPRVLKDQTAKLMTNILQDVVDNGTARRLRFAHGLTNDIAGKTGTTQNQTDGWFIGFTPNIVAGAWVGAEDRRVHFKTITNGQGARTALPIWGNFMASLQENSRYKSMATKSFQPLAPDLASAIGCASFVQNLPSATEVIEQQLAKDPPKRDSYNDEFEDPDDEEEDEWVDAGDDNNSTTKTTLPPLPPPNRTNQTNTNTSIRTGTSPKASKPRPSRPVLSDEQPLQRVNRPTKPRPNRDGAPKVFRPRRKTDVTRPTPPPKKVVKGRVKGKLRE